MDDITATKYNTKYSTRYFVAIHVDEKMLYCKTHDFESSRIKTVSWENASARCKDENAALPVFKSKEDLEEFLALLKLSKYKTEWRYDDMTIQPVAPSFHTQVLNFKVSGLTWGRRSVPPSPENYQIIFIGLKTHPKQKVQFNSSKGILVMCCLEIKWTWDMFSSRMCWQSESVVLFFPERLCVGKWRASFLSRVGKDMWSEFNSQFLCENLSQNTHPQQGTSWLYFLWETWYLDFIKDQECSLSGEWS